MRNALRTFLVGLMVVGMLVNPAVAWHCCGGGFAPVYYGGYDCGGCCGCEVACDDCCGGCDSCGETVVHEGAVVEQGGEAMPDQAPLPPEEEPGTTPPQEPATVERPAETELVPPPLPSESTTTPPAEVPPAEAPAEAPADLFDAPAETPPAEPAPTTEPAAPAETPATPPAEDDLFGGESTEAAPATEPAPAEDPAAPPAEGEKAADDTDLFGSARGVLREAGGLDSNEMRMWVDNTGKYSVNARLIRFIDGHVRLMKDTGRTTTVPLNRLSERDLEFVNRQASAQKATAIQTAQTGAPAIGIAN